MSSSSRKRKHRSQGHGYSNYATSEVADANELEFLGHHKRYATAGTSNSFGGEDHSSNSFSEGSDLLPLQGLYIQAYEAEIVRGPASESTSNALEVVQYVPDADDSGKGWKTIPTIGSALIKLGDDGFATPLELGGMHNEAATPAPSTTSEGSITKPGIWVDRYDARLLLDPASFPTSASSHPPSRRSTQLPPDSPTGWSDLPSDAEDTFFLDSGEIEDYRRDQRRRENERAREARLKARVEEDDDDDDVIRFGEKADVWGGSDEEPDEACQALLHRTATHLVSSPNPAQLEMRILANHGNDKRFAFLRGRWSRAWNIAKAKARMGKETPNEKAAIGLLAGYGSGSSSEDDEEGDKVTSSSQGKPTAEPDQINSEKSKSPEVDEEALKEARRKRLKEWREKRQPNL